MGTSYTADIPCALRNSGAEDCTVQTHAGLAVCICVSVCLKASGQGEEEKDRGRYHCKAGMLRPEDVICYDKLQINGAAVGSAEVGWRPHRRQICAARETMQSSWCRAHSTQVVCTPELVSSSGQSALTMRETWELPLWESCRENSSTQKPVTEQCKSSCN